MVACDGDRVVSPLPLATEDKKATTGVKRSGVWKLEEFFFFLTRNWKSSIVVKRSIATISKAMQKGYFYTCQII